MPEETKTPLPFSWNKNGQYPAVIVALPARPSPGLR